MEKGSLIERRLDNVVLGKITNKDKNIIVGSGVGNDYSLIGGIVIADGCAVGLASDYSSKAGIASDYSSKVGIASGYKVGSGNEPAQIAWIKAVNNFCCSGATAEGARITMLLPEKIKESAIGKYMDILQTYAVDCGIPITGGHTQIADTVEAPFFSVQIVGTATGWKAERKMIRPGMAIIMCGYAGMMGTNMLEDMYGRQLSERFGDSFSTKLGGTFSEGYVFKYADCCVYDAARIAIGNEVHYIHDISCGGVYSALWQLGRWADCGFRIYNSRIPVRQETIEICECLDINPYLIDGSGGLLIICDDSDTVLKRLQDNGVRAEVIGRVTESPERIVVFGDNEERTLSPVFGDEIYNVLAK